MSRLVHSLAVGLLLVTSGCASGQALRTVRMGSVESLNERLAGRTVVLAHADRDVYAAVTNAKVVRTDSGLVVTSRTSAPVRLDALRSISYRPDGACASGAATGGLLGATPGLGVVALGLVARRAARRSDNVGEAIVAEGLGIALVAVGVGAAAVGLVIGANRGGGDRGCSRIILYVD